MKYNFSGFIWGSTNPYVIEILNDINNDYPVLHFYNYEFLSKETFEKSILDIYTTDDIDPNKVKNVKINSLLQYPLKYTYFKFYIENPNFRMKKPTNNNISQTVEQIKKYIRSKYKSKINNYIHDIIIHISDNFEQTSDIEKIMHKYTINRKNEFINLKYFLKCNFENNVFTRADVLVRKYSIEQYLNDKNYDFEFYKKMQKKRSKNEIGDSYVENFKILINSIKNNGFNNDYPIKYSLNYLLRDGSHRLSYLLILDVTFIKIEHMKWDNHGDYSINWFKKQSFSQTELNIINTKLIELNIKY